MKLTTAIVTGLAATVLTSSTLPADATTRTDGYNYRACHVYHNAVTSAEAEVCLRARIRPQSDGTGTVIMSRHVYAATNRQPARGRPDDWHACGDALDNPSVDPAVLRVGGMRHDFRKHFRSKRHMVLTDANNCERFYRRNIRVNAATTLLVLRWHVSINADKDRSDAGVLAVAPTGYACYFDLADHCSRAKL